MSFISSILDSLSNKTPKEQAQLSDHTFILLATISLVYTLYEGVGNYTYSNFFEESGHYLLSFLMSFGIIIVALICCNFAIKNYVDDA